jgi:hypothetical protein
LGQHLEGIFLVGDGSIYSYVQEPNAIETRMEWLHPASNQTHLKKFNVFKNSIKNLAL